MRVLLINPPYPFSENPTPPFGLMSLAAYLLEKGIEVRIEDYIITPYSAARVRSVLEEYKPDVVGATSVTMNVKTALAIIKDYKDCDSRIITVMGGPHVTFDADAILSGNPSVDVIVRGEGEITFHEMLQYLEKGESITGIPGISCRGNGAIINNPIREFIPDINVLPLPARHLVQLSKYRALGLPINMLTSRGCPHKCIFCVGSKMIGQKVRYFSVERVLDEFEMLSKLGFKQVNIVDDLFTSNKKRCMAICQGIIDRGIVFPWTAFARVDTVSRELLEVMKQAGCNGICFGVESGDQHILDIIKKKITLDKCRTAFAIAREVGIESMASMILGLPGESPETVERTMEFAKELSPCHGFHILSPFPGTEVREKSAEYGMTIFTDDWDKYDANQSVADTGLMPHQEIDRIVHEFNTAIERYLKSLEKKMQAGEQIPDYDRQMLHNLGAFDFAMTVIVDELVEKFPGAGNTASSGDIIERFSAYIGESSKFSAEVIREQVERLISLQCLIVDPKGKQHIRWA